MNLTPEQRKRYADPTNHNCACSKPAVKRVGGAFVCQSCLDIEKRMDQRGRAPATFSNGTHNPNFKYIEVYGIAH